MNRKQEAFVNEYVKCWNASEAARRAGYSKRSAGVYGHELLHKPEISEKIEQKIEELKMSADECLMLLADEARKGRGSTKVRALELIGKHKKLFTERIEHQGSMEQDIKVHLAWPEDNGD